MSVLIKGMKKPKDCGECIFEIFGGCHINLNIEPKNKLTHSCPLVELPDHGELYWNNTLMKNLVSVMKTIPTIDAVPVVRCKDCKYMTEHYDTDGNVPYWTCSQWDSGTDYDGFCHYAERSEE